MAFDANSERDQITSLTIKYQTIAAQMDRLTQKCADMREMVCAKEHSDGSISINFDLLADKLGPGQCLELRAAIDARWGIRGEPGQKPRMTVRAEVAA